MAEHEPNTLGTKPVQALKSCLHLLKKTATVTGKPTAHERHRLTSQKPKQHSLKGRELQIRSLQRLKERALKLFQNNCQVTWGNRGSRERGRSLCVPLMNRQTSRCQLLVSSLKLM